MAKSHFAKAIFHLERDILPVNKDVDCPFEVTDSLDASGWDWIGLFRVGWRSQKDYVTYQYLALPADYKKGTKAFSKVTFTANTLPKDEEFYQFCFVSWHLNAICGASDPFQFRSTSGKEYVEEEMEDMMIIRDKKDVMQDEIQKLSHKLMVLTKERDDLQGDLLVMEKTVGTKDTVISKLQTQISTLRQIEEQDREKITDMAAKMKDLQFQVKTLEEEKDCMKKEVITLHQKRNMVVGQINSLKASIRTLTSERDELSGQNQSLQDELNTYKTQVMESQTLATQSGKTITKLNESLELAYNQCATVVEECEELKKDKVAMDKMLQSLKEQMEQVTAGKKVAESKREELAHELSNANDKLLACDTVKIRLGQDLEAYEMTQRNMNSKFEDQESELLKYKEMADQKEKECVSLEKKLRLKLKELEDRHKDLSHAEATLNQTLVEAEDGMKGRQAMAERLAKLERECVETRKQLDLVTAQLRVVSDEKTALQMQLRTFEDELQGTLVVKDNEVAAKLVELKEKTQLIEQKEEELVQSDAQVGVLQEQVVGLSKQVETQSQSLQEAMETLQGTQTQLSQLQESHSQWAEVVECLERERDALAQKHTAMMEEKSRQEKAWQEQEASSYYLMKANESFKARLEVKEKEMTRLVQAKQNLESCLEYERLLTKEKTMEVGDLKNRLELGKMEYADKAIENAKLHRQSRKEDSQDAETENEGKSPKEKKKPYLGVAMKISQLEAENELLRNAYADLEDRLRAKERHIKQLEVPSCMREPEACEEEEVFTDVDQMAEAYETYLDNEQESEDEDEAPANKGVSDKDLDLEETMQAQLMYGNPYNSNDEATVDSPMQQSIIRSTLEEEAGLTSDPMGAAAEEEEEGQELPPPLLPEVVVSEGAAASALTEEDSTTEECGHDTFEDCLANMPTSVPELKDMVRHLLPPNQDESFLDALGEGMKICPFCQASILASSDFEEHVATHFGRICPVCRCQADDNVTPEVFEQHVNKCLDKEAASAPPKEEPDFD